MTNRLFLWQFWVFGRLWITMENRGERATKNHIQYAFRVVLQPCGSGGKRIACGFAVGSLRWFSANAAAQSERLEFPVIVDNEI